MVKQTIQRLGFFYRKLTQRQLDVLDQIVEDHIRVEFHFLLWRMTRDDVSRKDLFKQIKKELALHLDREEAVFYPACDQFEDLKVLIKDSREEHAQIKVLLKQISALAQDSQEADEKMKRLVEEVEFHVSEEENDLIPQVRKHMQEDQLNQLGKEFGAWKRPVKLRTKPRTKSRTKIAA